MRVRFLSLFSGIGGFDIGLEAAGMACVGQIEIDPFCRHVLAHHWPHVKRIEDIHNVNGNNNAAGSSPKAGDGLGTAVKLWPTPIAGEARAGTHCSNQTTLSMAVSRMRPTPSASMMTEADMEQARYAGNDPRRPTYRAAALLSTPRSSDGEKGCRTPKGAAKERLRRPNGQDLPTVAGGSLNPEFVEYLMGFPIGYTDCGPWAMPSSRKLSKKSAAQ